MFLFLITDASSGLDLGINGLPYPLPIHPNLVHFTVGLFVLAIFFDVFGFLYPLERPIMKLIHIKPDRAAFFDLGWWNLLAVAIVTFFTVAAGFFEMLLADPPPSVLSPWGLPAFETMYLHGVGGVFSLMIIVLLTIWRGFQRYQWRRKETVQVEWRYVVVSLIAIVFITVQAEMGAQLAGTFGIHNTAARLIRQQITEAELASAPKKTRTVSEAIAYSTPNLPQPKFYRQGQTLYFGIDDVMDLPQDTDWETLLSRLNQKKWSADQFKLSITEENKAIITLDDQPLLITTQLSLANNWLYRLQKALV
ncbi:MAG: DUF2231 domain-containing protein [Gloeocapsa sp. DLM2.Bin57]|nr:MAG: DUF2231 domain-containing protein [Gloeocapsa sp. DLM2.Bin57]